MALPSGLGSSSSIQGHLYDAFIHHETCDVSLVCVGAVGHHRGGSDQHQPQQQWTASYESHRVILIQAGYFKSLFTSGFAESQSSPLAASGPGRRRAYSYAELDVRLRFDDPNITRAAFELCLARLYGGGPQLHLPDDLQSTLSHPLTRTFPVPPSSIYPSSSNPPSTPPDHHVATPRFLLSLLATATYLGMPSVASEALGLIMLSIGPWTVVRYLNFALGKGIGLDRDNDDESFEDSPLDDDDLRSATGLEHVAQDVSIVSDDYPSYPPRREPSGTQSHSHHAHFVPQRQDSADSSTLPRSTGPSRAASIKSHRSVASRLTATVSIRSRPGTTRSHPSAASVVAGISQRSTHTSAKELKDKENTGGDFEVIEKSQGASSDEDSARTTAAHGASKDPHADNASVFSSFSEAADHHHDDDDLEDDDEMPYFYGAVGNQIGEACACWLGRWSQDILEYEEVVWTTRKREAEARVGDDRLRRQNHIHQPSPLSPYASSSFNDSSRHEGSPPSSASYLSVGSPVDDYDPLTTTAGKALSSIPSLIRSEPHSRPTQSTGKGKSTLPISPSPPSLLRPKRSDLCIWAPGGLSTRWIRGVISSDSFFIPDERARYEFGARVWRLRDTIKALQSSSSPSFSPAKSHRGPSTPPRMDSEWETFFRTGVYYTHMSFNDLREVEAEGLIPTDVLMQAHWTQSLLKGTVLSAKPGNSRSGTAPSASMSMLNLGGGPNESTTTIGGGGSSPPGGSGPSSQQPQRELGLTLTTAHIRATLNDPDPMRAARAARKTYFPVFNDGSARFGDYLSGPGPNADGSTPGGSGQQQPPDYSSSPLFAPLLGFASSTNVSTPAAGRPGTAGSETGGAKSAIRARLPASEEDFFGLRTARRTANAVVAEDESGTQRWTEFEPFRFSAEWWGAETLKEKSRLYSVTIPYAGSLFNVYIQVVRKKGLQLGLYLHRQSMVDPIPAPSSAPGSTSASYFGPTAATSGASGAGGGGPTAGGYLTGGAGGGPPTLQHSQSLIFTPRAYNPSTTNDGLNLLGGAGPGVASTSAAAGSAGMPFGQQMQIQTRVSQYTGAVTSSLSSSPPTPTAALTSLPYANAAQGGVPRVSSPGASGSRHHGGGGITTTYTTFYRSSPPASPSPYSGPQTHVHPPSHSHHPPHYHSHGYTMSYRDPRSSVRAYFSIACPSAIGTSMTVFKSVPDDFAVDGSWGWRSSACVEIPMTSTEDGEGKGRARASTVGNTAAVNASNFALGRSRGLTTTSAGNALDNAIIQQWLRELTSVRAMIVIGVV